MPSFPAEPWILNSLLVLVIFLLGIIWRDLNGKIKTLFRRQEKIADTTVGQDTIEGERGVFAQIRSVRTAVDQLSNELTDHMKTERLTYALLFIVTVFGFSALTIGMVILYFQKAGA